jgi:hypothetical protein
MKVSKGIFRIVLLSSVFGLLQGCSDAKEPSNQTTNTVTKEETKPRVYIDEVYKLQELTQQLVDYKYNPPYIKYKQFSRIKENLAIGIEPTCNYFDELVRTTGESQSQYREDAIRCSNTVLSMTAVLLDLKDGNHKSIREQRGKIVIINDYLIKQLDEYRNTPQYKAGLNNT